MQYFTFVVTFASIIGTVANSFKKRWCFYVWLCTNAFWCIYNAANGQAAQSLLYAFNFVMAIIGIVKWKQPTEGEKNSRGAVKRNRSRGMTMRFESNEAAEQETVISFCELMANRYPELSLIYHVPNGGKRSKTEAARFKRQGVKPGVPDLVLPVPRHGFHGLYIEMKYGKNKASGEQSWWLEQLTAQGYMCVLCVGADAAIRTICDYMRIKGG